MSLQQFKVEKKNSQSDNSAKSEAPRQLQPSPSSRTLEEAGAPASNASGSQSGIYSSGRSHQRRRDDDVTVTPNSNFQSQHRQHNGYRSTSLAVPKQIQGRPKNNGLLPKPQLPHVSDATTSEPLSSNAPDTLGVESKEMDLVCSIQFGSFLCNDGLQIPSKTSLAASNINEKKQNQECFALSNELQNLGTCTTLARAPQRDEEEAASKKGQSQVECLGQDVKTIQGGRKGTISMETHPIPTPRVPQPASASAIPSLAEITKQQSSSKHVLPSNLQAQILQQVSQVSGPQSSLPLQFYGLSNPLPQGVIHQLHGVNYPQRVHEVSQMMPQVNPPTNHVPSSQLHISQMPFHMNPQIAVPFGNHMPNYGHQVTYVSSRPVVPVKIRHPDTREEVTIGRNTLKSDTQGDNNVTASPSVPGTMVATSTEGRLGSVSHEVLLPSVQEPLQTANPTVGSQRSSIQAEKPSCQNVATALNLANERDASDVDRTVEPIASENKIRCTLSPTQASHDNGKTRKAQKSLDIESEIGSDTVKNEVTSSKSGHQVLMTFDKVQDSRTDLDGLEETAPSHRDKHEGKDLIKAAGMNSSSNEKLVDSKENAQECNSKVAVDEIAPCPHSSSVLNESEKQINASNVVTKKKRKKQTCSKADAAIACKISEGKDIQPEPSREVINTPATMPLHKAQKPVPKEWVTDSENDSELLSSGNQVDKPEVIDSQGKKYSMDFLLALKGQHTGLPTQFKASVEVMDILVSSQSQAGLLKGGEMLATGRIHDRPSGKGHRLDRRISSFPGGEEDRWIKQTDPFGAGRDFRSGRKMRMNSGNSDGSPLGSSSGQLTRNKSDGDRWQRLPVAQKGLIFPPLSSLPSIHKSENRYELRKVTDQEEARQRQIKAILNKLTPQNFDKLFVQVNEVNIDSADCLKGVISQIFDKALMEPTFCEMYAKFCKRLSHGLPEFHKDSERVGFKRVLLNKCQEEFERDEREQEEADSDRDGEKEVSEAQKEEKRAATRRRMLGNIRFIGELFKESMLTERIMHECIRKLLGQYQNPYEENVEALCKLMSTIGHMIDHKKSREHIDAYFDRMTSMSNNQCLPSRLRFMLKDLLDMRKNSWQQRRKVEGPKKIEEVHREAAQELQGSRPRGSSVGYTGRRSMPLSDHASRGQQHWLPSQDARASERGHFEHKPLPSRSSNYGPITLGPHGQVTTDRAQSFSSNKGSVSNILPGTSISNNRREVVGPMANATSSSDRVTNMGNGIAGRIYVAGKVLQTAMSNTYVNCSNPGSPEKPASPQVSEDKLKQRSEMTIKEFYSAGDLNEVVLCMEELKAPSFYSTMLSSWILDSFDRKDREREELARLLTFLFNKTPCPLNKQQLLEGLETVFSLLEDSTCDAPKAPEFLGKMLGRLVIEDILFIHDITNAIAVAKGEEESTFNVLGTVLQVIKISKGADQLCEMYRKSEIKLETFLPSGWELADFERFLEKKDIQCLHKMSIARH